MNKKQQQNENQRFWSGYALGAFMAGMAAFAFGTQTGRNKIRYIIDSIESHKNPSEIVNSMSNLFVEVLRNNSQQNPSDVNQVISKMKTISSEEHKSKKFISK